MPNSTTANRWAAFRRNTVNGTPMWLFRLPEVANAASPWAARRMLAIIWVTVVLPLLPVTPISGRRCAARQAVAKVCKAASGSSTRSPGMPVALKPWLAKAATAPAAWA